MTQPRFVYVEFGPGVADEEYGAFYEAVTDLAEATMAKYPADCDNDIWVSEGGGMSMNKDRAPKQPFGPGAFCDQCGHFAARHGTDGCSGIERACRCDVMHWGGYKWPRPWLPAPKGLRKE